MCGGGRTQKVHSGATAPMLGIEFAKSIGLVGDKLKPGINYTGASGELKRCVGVSRDKVKFILDGGGVGETTVELEVMVENATSYDVLAGGQFIGRIGGVIDYWAQTFMYRLDW